MVWDPVMVRWGHCIRHHASDAGSKWTKVRVYIIKAYYHINSVRKCYEVCAFCVGCKSWKTWLTLRIKISFLHYNWARFHYQEVWQAPIALHFILNDYVSNSKFLNSHIFIKIAHQERSRIICRAQEYTPFTNPFNNLIKEFNSFH